MVGLYLGCDLYIPQGLLAVEWTRQGLIKMKVQDVSSTLLTIQKSLDPASRPALPSCFALFSLLCRASCWFCRYEDFLSLLLPR